MIRELILTAAAATLVTACNTATDPDKALRADCDTLVTDPEAQRNISDMSTDGDGFCSCMIQLANAKDAEVKASIVLALDVVTAKMTQTNQGAEDVVGTIMRDAMMPDGDESKEQLMKGIRETGQLIDDIENAFEDGTCTPKTA